MKIAIAGSSGFIGTALINFLQSKGHEVYRLVRKQEEKTNNAVYWDPDNGLCPSDNLEGYDAVINLSGENVACRWTEAKKESILQSRVKSTKVLSACLAELQKPPAVLINASAMGYYGNQGDNILTEESPNGTGFLARVCREWEEATSIAQQRGIRVVTPRIGIVLSPDGGALAKMLIPFRLGLGGTLGSGKQYMSWITLDDLLRVILFLISNDLMQGPVNATTPNPLTNAEFTKTLGKVLKAPTFLPAPAFLLRLLFGDMADEMLLSSVRLEPARLQVAGYSFLYPDLEGALHHLLKK